MESPPQGFIPQIIIRTLISLLIALGFFWLLMFVYPQFLFNPGQLILVIFVFLVSFLPLTYQLIRSLTSVNLLCEQRLLYQTLLNKITDLFIKETDPKMIIPSSLSLLGIDLGLSRALLFRFDANTNSLVLAHQWTAEDVAPVSKKEQLPLVQYPILNQWLKENDAVYTYNTRSLTDPAARSLFNSQDVSSLISFPLVLSTGIFGLLFLEHSNPKKYFNEEIDVLKSIATIIATTQEKDRSQSIIDNLTLLRQKFVDMVGHEIKSPLSALQHNLDSLLSARLGPLNDSQTQLLSLISQIGSDLNSNLANLLLMLDFEDGKITLTKSKTSLDQIIQKQLPEFISFCRLKNIEPVIQPYLQGSSDVFIDPGMIGLVVKAILKNAVTYSPQNTSIETKLDKTSYSFTFTVIDHGIGIPLPDQNKIFTPFFRARNAYTQLNESAGIDLFIAKNIIEAHGGHIGFVSQPGTGSTFWFSLPL